MNKLIVGLLLLFSANASALDVDPYVFTKTSVGYEQADTGKPYSVASSLIEVGLELPKNLSVGYQYYVSRPEFEGTVEIHSLSVSYKFYKVWE